MVRAYGERKSGTRKPTRHPGSPGRPQSELQIPHNEPYTTEQDVIRQLGEQHKQVWPGTREDQVTGGMGAQ